MTENTSSDSLKQSEIKSAPYKMPDPDTQARIMRRERFTIRWFNFSLNAYRRAKVNKLPRVPTFLLITKGRKSGKWIEQPIYYFRDGENYVVIGSKGGTPKHPIWFLNLEADPDCKIYVRWRTHAMRARVATGEERARVWANAAKQFPDYDSYQAAAAPREIPVVVLEKR